MRIKRVEIIGFKSFCDRAVVQIGESITGVVGPNGCGKSNIVDAIRWCMGEQSAKHLRGKAMEDVIFAGSETRGPAPMAEVSLTFEDVGFSHETLELAKNDETETMLDAIPDEPGDDSEDDEGEGAGESAGEGAGESAAGDGESAGNNKSVEAATDAPAPATEPGAADAAEGNAGLWVDAEGNRIDSPVEEVAKLLEDRAPAADFGSYTEVTITRRLYRDGLSQYFINKTPCRLRDITDFFLGTGVGTKAYAIIEQGRIGQIVSSRPQDRRTIIEEAAGITKFKAKKKAAERKLDQTRQNLMRVSDIVTELDKRMGTLRRQAQKAERYRKYKTEMKDIELWKASHRWLELQGETQLVGGRLDEVRSELDTARVEWTSKDAALVAERAELSIEERRLAGVQDKVYELDNTIRLGDSKIGFELREADDLEARIAGARTEIDEVRGQRERGKVELDARSAELATLEADVARETGEVAAREAAAGEARQMLANTEGRLEEARTQIAERTTQIATARTQLEALSRRREEASGRLDRVTTETDEHAGKVKELEREGKRVDGALAQLRQTRLELGSQGDDFAVRRDTLADTVARGEAEVETLRTELHRRRSRLVSLEEIQERYEGFARGTRAVMQGSFGDQVADRLDGDPIRGIVADVVRAPELLEVAVEAALGDRLGGVLVADHEIGVAAIGYLKQEGGGRSAFVPVAAQDASAGIPEVVPDDKLGEARFESAATRSLGVPQPIATPNEPDVVDDGWSITDDADAVVAGYVARRPALATGLDELPPLDDLDDLEGLEAILAHADRSLDDARSDNSLPAGHDADAAIARIGAALRARSLEVDAMLADPLHAGIEADASLGMIGTALRARSLEVDAMLAARDVPSGNFDPAALHADACVTSIGAALRARSLRADARLAARIEQAAAPIVAADLDVAIAPDKAAPASGNRPFEFEDRTQLVSALVDAARDEERGETGEGVLGRMADLVDFTEGFEQVGKRLLGRTVVVDDLRRAIGLRERGVTDRLVTLEGDIVDEDGVVAGGSREAQGAGVLAQKREIRDLQEIVGRLEHDLSEAMQRLVTARAELSQVTKAIDGLRVQVHEGDVAIVGHEKDDARVRGELERHKSRLGQLATEQLELESRLAAIAGDETVQRERLEQATAELQTLEQTQVDAIAEVASHRERLEELANVLTEARIRAAQLEAQRAAVEAATLRLAQTDAELAARADRLASECEDSTTRAAALREGCEKLAQELAATREQREAESKALEEGRAAYHARVEGLSEIELAARELRTRADDLATELNQLELRHGQIGMTRQVLEDQIGERYQVELVGVLHDYHQRQQVTEAEDDRLAELRELIGRMGSDINLTAIDEFADVSQRFEFLAAQKIDLERAVDQLQRAIDKINKTSRKLFKDTFAAVNATFKEVFPRLFRGGRAALSLSVPSSNLDADNPDAAPREIDLLEAGIEIMAQPPGKKNATVDQLSGGEKALTAVALVFSIFLIKPSPFCILDEVDAPLDEANVDRYNEIVREMTDRSQFIVITHNKRTMESADNLYGVTMQEPGVSKLVSVNLSKLGPSERPAKQTERHVAI